MKEAKVGLPFIYTKESGEALHLQTTITRDRFEELILRHPLMVNFARSLVWGVYDANHNLIVTFRASEEGDLMDVEDAEVELAADHVVGLVHPGKEGEPLQDAEKKGLLHLPKCGADID